MTKPAPIVVSLPTSALFDDLAPGPPGTQVVLWDMRSRAPLRRIDLVVTPYLNSLDPLRWLVGVKTRLVQSPAIGYDGIAEVIPAGHVVANGAGLHEATTAEFALALTLAAQRGIPKIVLAQQEQRWPPLPVLGPSLAGRRVLLVGYGGLGHAIAARLAPFEVHTTVVASQARMEHSTRIHGVSELPDLLPRAEIVIVAVPLASSTTHLVDDEFLSAMAEDALLVNISRGAVADTDALVRHAALGRLRLALDVIDPEPLPAEHPLWHLPNVLISPHTAGASIDSHPRLVTLVKRQIAHLLAGEDPENVVLQS